MIERILNCRIKCIKSILYNKPKYICTGFLEESEIEFLLLLNDLGIIKHLLFSECDDVECYIELEWNDKIG